MCIRDRHNGIKEGFTEVSPEIVKTLWCFIIYYAAVILNDVVCSRKSDGLFKIPARRNKPFDLLHSLHRHIDNTEKPGQLQVFENNLPEFLLRIIFFNISV